jgi:putative ABC transport system substrate-binding protein
MAKPKEGMKKLGFLNSASSKELAGPLAAFHRGMKQAGFVEGKGVAITYRWAKHDLGRLPELARKLVEAGVDVLAATGGLASAQAAVEAARSSAVRVVFVGGFDPVKAKLVDDLDRPSGNATGVSTSSTESLPHRLKLATELLNGTKVAVLVKPDTVIGRLEQQQANGAPVLAAGTEGELKARFAEAKKAGYAVLVGADAFFTSKRKQIVALAKQNGVPAIYPWREYVDIGGLMSYGPSLANAYRQAGFYVGKILADGHCANPPVLQPTCFEHVINLKTARALGLAVPAAALSRVSHVIE